MAGGMEDVPHAQGGVQRAQPLWQEVWRMCPFLAGWSEGHPYGGGCVRPQPPLRLADGEEVLDLGLDPVGEVVGAGDFP